MEFEANSISSQVRGYVGWDCLFVDIRLVSEAVPGSWGSIAEIAGSICSLKFTSDYHRLGSFRLDLEFV